MGRARCSHNRGEDPATIANAVSAGRRAASEALELIR